MPTARIYLHLICRKRFFSSAFTPVPIRFLRLPDREQLTKPVYAERMNPFPTTLFLCRQNITTEQASPFPTRCAAKLSSAPVLREATMVSANVPNRAAAKRSIALTYGEATMVSTNASNRAATKLSNAPVLRETLWFLPMPRTGLPEICVSVGASMRL